MSQELFSDNLFPEPTLSEILGIDSSIRSVGGIIEGTNIKSSSGSGGVAILPPENTDIGLYVYDNEGNTVFNTLIDGDNVGDVYLGDFANNQGIWYDKSAGASGTVYIKGNVYIGGTTVFESGYDPSGKANVFRQDTEPASGMVEKDIWIDTNNGDKPYSYNGSAWIAQYTIIDGGSISTGTIDADLVTVSNLSATNITAGTLSVDRISAGSIVSSKVGTDLTDSNISSINFNNITATNVVADSVSASNITAGTLTGSIIQTSSTGKRIKLDTSTNSIILYDSAEGSSTIYNEGGVLVLNCDDSIEVMGHLYPNAGSTYDLGDTPNNKWRHLYLSGNIVIDGTVDGTNISTHVGNASAHHVKYSDSDARGAIDDVLNSSGNVVGDFLPNSNTYDLGDSGNYWRNIYLGGIKAGGSTLRIDLDGGTSYYLSIGSQYYSGTRGASLSNLADQVPSITASASVGWESGTSAKKWYSVTALHYYSCPLPSVISGIASLKKVKDPKSLNGESGQRHYIKDEDMPDEMKSRIFKKDSKGKKYLSDEKAIDLTATMGVTLQAVRELITKVEILEEKVDNIK